MFNYGHIQSKLAGPQITIVASSPKNVMLTREIEAVIDSGAVMTCLPKYIINELDEENLDFSVRTVRGALDNGRECITYFVNIRFSDDEYEDVEIIPLDKDYALIGRDIMNRYDINLNGPQKIWSHK